jgi:predicted AAA+ superfamily ATPase
VARLDDVTRFLLDNVGNILSTTRVSRTLTSAGRNVNQRTVEKYVSALTDGLLFYEARRFDVKGTRLLERLEKYYAVDPGFRALFGGGGMDVGRVLENVVYLELVRRGYEVCVGQWGTQEIDFVATRTSERWYIQVAATVRDASVLARELAPLEALADSYPKLILTLDDDPTADHAGITRTNALFWLLGHTRR